MTDTDQIAMYAGMPVEEMRRDELVKWWSATAVELAKREAEIRDLRIENFRLMGEVARYRSWNRRPSIAERVLRMFGQTDR